MRRDPEPRSAIIALALREVGLCALADRTGRACVDVYYGGIPLDEAIPTDIVAYFDLEPFEALDDLGIAQEILRRMGEYLKL